MLTFYGIIIGVLSMATVFSVTNDSFASLTASLAVYVFIMFIDEIVDQVISAIKEAGSSNKN